MSLIYLIKLTFGKWCFARFEASCLSLRVNSHFPGEPGLAGVYWSKGWWRWWWQLDYWSYKSCKVPVKSSPPTNQQPVFLQARCPSCRATNSVKALKGIFEASCVKSKMEHFYSPWCTTVWWYTFLHNFVNFYWFIQKFYEHNLRGPSNYETLCTGFVAL